MKNRILIIALPGLCFCLLSCGNDKTANKENIKEKDQPVTSVVQPSATDSLTQPVSDDAAISSLETSDYVLKIHRAIEFTQAPKAYQPVKIDPSTKLVVLDVSVKNKLSTPLNFSRILGMTVIKGTGDKNLLSPWVVATYMVDHPDPGHQKEYDALWSSNFEANGFHRAILLGLNPAKEQKEFTLIIPEKPDFNNPSKKSVVFTIQ